MTGQTSETGLERALDRATGALPGGGEARTGQREMARAVASSIATGRHLVVQAGTGTGKSLAYLVPAILSGRRVVVATATKALQDQLAARDLPLLQRSLGRQFDFAVLKGRSNYLCRQRASELATGDQARSLTGRRGEPKRKSRAGRDELRRSGNREVDDQSRGSAVVPPAGLEDELRRITTWAEHSDTGDRAELSFEPSARAWSLMSVGTQECPGRSSCPHGNDCFAERARETAAEADVVVTNMHLYGAHLASGNAVLPEHDVVVFDEAHEWEDVATASLGHEISAAQMRNLARVARPLIGGERLALASELEAAAERLDEALAPLVGQRMSPSLGGTQSAVAQALALATERLSRLTSALRQPGATQGKLSLDMGSAAGAMADPARARALQAAGKLAEDLASVDRLGSDDVAWVERRGQFAPVLPDGSRAPDGSLTGDRRESSVRMTTKQGFTAPSDRSNSGQPSFNPGIALRDQYLTLRVAPIEVGPSLAKQLWGTVTAVLTSATVPAGMATRLGLRMDFVDQADVGSPFPYATNALLYCAAHLPDRRHPTANQDLHAELTSLITAAGGRTLALFTSWRGMTEAARAARERLPFRILTQDELPKTALLSTFSNTESICLFATMGFWQGVDLPGPTLSLVVIDRIPFPRPDDPLMSARRERAGSAAFRTIDLPRAAMLLAQGAGRLIRSSSDRGVVAILDRRLAHSSYRWDLVRALPPMARTRHRSEVDRFLAEVLSPADRTLAPLTAALNRAKT